MKQIGEQHVKYPLVQQIIHPGKCSLKYCTGYILLQYAGTKLTPIYPASAINARLPRELSYTAFASVLRSNISGQVFSQNWRKCYPAVCSQDPRSAYWALHGFKGTPLLQILLHCARKCILLQWITDITPSVAQWISIAKGLIPNEAYSKALRDKPVKFHRIWDPFLKFLGVEAEYMLSLGIKKIQHGRIELILDRQLKLIDPPHDIHFSVFFCLVCTLYYFYYYFKLFL